MAGQTVASKGTPEVQPAAQPAAKKEPTIKSKGIAALVSLFFPGVGLALCNPSRVIEGVAVFVIAIGLDAVIAMVSIGGGPLAGLLTQGVCCILTPILMLGLFLIPVIHIIGAIHTYVRG